MAEKNEDEQIPPSVPNDLESVHNDQVRIDFHEEIKFVQDIIYKFVSCLPKDEISVEERRHSCTCVNSIIVAYEGKLKEIDGLKKVVQMMKRREKEMKRSEKEQNKKIAKLQNTLTEILAAACEECKKIQQFSSLSVQDDKTESPTPSETEVDGRAEENEETDENEMDFVSDVESEFSFVADIRCPAAPCGLVALLCLFYRKKIYFCATKFIQKYGATTRHLAPCCTKILENLQHLHYLKPIYTSNQIGEGEHGEVLKTAEDKLRASNQEVGLLLYSTVAYKHCVTVYIPKEGKMRIQDGDLELESVKDFGQVRSLQIVVLSCNPKGELKIVKKWGDQCHRDKCFEELRQLSEPENSENTSSPSDSTMGSSNPGV